MSIDEILLKDDNKKLPGPNDKSISVLDNSKSKSYSILIQNYDHVTFYTWQSKSKSGLRLGKSNPSLI